jgi:hypothetical protein
MYSGMWTNEPFRAFSRMFPFETVVDCLWLPSGVGEDGAVDGDDALAGHEQQRGRLDAGPEAQHPEPAWAYFFFMPLRFFFFFTRGPPFSWIHAVLPAHAHVQWR